MKLYCIYDRNAELANAPFVMPNNAMAIRNFQMQVNRPGTAAQPNVLALYPDDFQLLFIGDMDDKTCVVYQDDHTVLLCTAKELLTPPRRVIKYSQRLYLTFRKS